MANNYVIGYRDRMYFSGKLALLSWFVGKYFVGKHITYVEIDYSEASVVVEEAIIRRAFLNQEDLVIITSNGVFRFERTSKFSIDRYNYSVTAHKKGFSFTFKILDSEVEKEIQKGSEFSQAFFDVSGEY